MISTKSKNTEQYDKLKTRVNSALADVDKLCETTPTPAYGAAPDPNILKVLLQECEDSAFW